jgi:SpoVK/Ycf46/Vps4 family AAA+-type ATPase
MPTGWKRQDSKPPQPGPTPKVAAGPAVAANSAPAPTEMGSLEMFTPATPTRSLEDLIVSAPVRSRIEAAVNRIRYHEVLYRHWNLESIDPRGRRVAINLYGPPGTGKTFCADAIANHLKKRIITVNYAEIESKYVGETPKNIVGAFSRARETESVLFFDEADSILGKRLTSVTQSADHGVNVSRSVMLLQLDAFDGVVVFATNLAQNYDGAFVRRIAAHIEFELPDFGCRTRLWAKLVPTQLPREDGVTPIWLSEQSDGLSGGDMLNALIAAATRAVARDAPVRLLRQADLLDEIAHVRRARTQVGQGGGVESEVPMEPRVQEKEVPIDELPPDVREHLRSLESEEKKGRRSR